MTNISENITSSEMEKRQGLAVLKLSQKAGERYEVDEDALASVLLRPEVRSLPVVVVSVAGAYRGGKSFLLDFFLRYLTAPRSDQLSGVWLGNDEEQLKGFDWRGGCEANTKGIHIWQEPIVVTNDRTGEKVAVLLMDTQGTFDTESDVGDNSTIFALSTLLSSVQIYNIQGNIGEDDLQHLQLFTEYGRLACDAQGKAFQTLMFLVRDWVSPFQHPHGYTGGEALLKKRLTPKPDQKKQLREVREHIHSCFEKLQCFLMPHPGLAVTEEHFQGHLRDISDKFKTFLLELVPSIFDPENLTPKTINGDKIQAQSILDYFKQYVDVFNSDELPEATTIFQATADACMLSALREARSHYETKMESNILEDQSVSPSMMQDWHNAAATVAFDYFKGKKKIGAQDNLEPRLEELRKELEARLSLYMWQNDAKTRDTVTRAKKAYEDCIAEVCEVQTKLCLHTQDLSVLHQRALQDALEIFDRARTLVPDETDEERIRLIQELEQRHQHLTAINEQNNRAATLEARELYLSRMKEQVTKAGVSAEVLERQHEKIMAEALEHFHSFRNQRTEETEDPEVTKLEQEIEEYFVELEKNNIHSNIWAMQVAEYTYNNHVSATWSPHSCCFHPDGLVELHDAAKERSLEQFLTDRVESENDEYKHKLIAKLDARFEELQRINNFNNKQVVDQAFSEYTRLMDKHCRPSLGSYLLTPTLMKLLRLTKRHHDSSKSKAMEIFSERRRGGSYNDDPYLAELNKKIENAYDEYNNPWRGFRL